MGAEHEDLSSAFLCSACVYEYLISMMVLVFCCFANLMLQSDRVVFFVRDIRTEPVRIGFKT